MDKSTNTTATDVRKSISELYGGMLSKRAEEHNSIVAERQRLKEESRLEQEEQEQDIASKREKREKALDDWKDVISSMTGDDLIYSADKKKKKKYNVWIGDELAEAGITIDKPKKRKKKDYNKEFANELNMLKTIVSEQNRFTDELQKRLKIMMGPNTKDAMPLNKTAVELAATVNSARSNSLSIVKAISDMKKTIADLTMKEKKLIHDLGKGGPGDDTADIGLMGSSLLSMMGGQSVPQTSYNHNQGAPAQGNTNFTIEEMDPAAFQFEGDVDPMVKYENTPHRTLIQYNTADNTHRYKTINTATGDEIPDYPNPSFNISNIDVSNKLARDSFDNVYELEVI